MINMKNTFVNTPQCKDMLKDLSLPDDELIVAESIRYALKGSSNPKKIVEDIVSIDVDPVSGEETVCVDRLELMNAINACLALVTDLIPEEEMSDDPNVPDAVDMLNDIDEYDMVIRICAGLDGGAFAEFLGRLYDMFCK
ncbi:MAG: hypothetical protein LUD18_03180 [Lachnospiraceae bacterium]|nr:hypothetical protein [Lachnospiraceae bacterium]